MSPRSIAVLLALASLSSGAIALTLVPPHYPTKADFDWDFTAIGSASVLQPDLTAANRENLRMAALKQLNLD
jgi:hypothetical protein